MATESLIVELDARTAKLDAKLRATDAKLNALSGTTEKADGKMASLSKSAGAVGAGIAVVGAAAVAAAASIVSLSKSVGAYAKEIKIASDLSGIAVEKLQPMAHATATVGIGIEKLGDISKDTREKIGDFLNTGGGGFQDFVDAMKLTKEEARLVADEFSHLSGTEILQEMVTRMEDANVSAVQMSHALEGMASDTTNLIPLLRDGGREMERLSNEMSSVTIPLTDADIDVFVDMGESVDIASAAIKSMGEQTLLKLADSFMAATDAVGFFFATLNEGTEAQKTSRLVDIKEEIDELQKGIDNSKTAAGRLWNVLTFNTSQESFALERINELLKERGEIQEDLSKSRFGIGEDGEDGGDGKKPRSSGGLGGLSADDVEKRKQAVLDSLKTEQELLTEKYKVEQELFKENEEVLFQLKVKYKEDLAELNRDTSIEAIADRFKTEEELLTEKLERELEKVGNDKQLRKELEERFIEDMIAMNEDYAKEQARIQENAAKTELRLARDKDRLKSKEDRQAVESARAEEKLINDGMALAQMAFGENKEISAAIAFINTAQGVTAALAKYDFVGAGVIAASGALQISSILSASPGSTGGVSSPNSPTPQQGNFTPDAGADLDFTSSTSTGSGQTVITFAEDSGDEIVDVIARALNKGQSEGRF